jgi:cell division protein FtsB
VKKLFSNRYFLLFLALTFWLAFFDKNNFVYQYKLSQELRGLEKEKHFYQKQITDLRAQKLALNSDIDLLEKFAREHYLMKRKGEDLYLLKEK